MALEYDAVHFEEDVNGNYRIRETPADLNYPLENLVALGTVYGLENAYTGTANLSAARPTTPRIRVVNNFDDTATATISGSDTGSTNTVWVFLRHGGVLELVNGGSRTGDGDVTLTNVNGEYIGYVVSEVDNILSVPSNPDGFWITDGNTFLQRTALAETELQVIRLNEKGIQVEFQNGKNATPVTVWATVSNGTSVTTLRGQAVTDVSDLTFYIPRQTGFPPTAFKPGATVTYDSVEYQIDVVRPSNGIDSLSNSWELTTGNYRTLGNF